MNNTKFLHIGDIHLDSKFVGLDERKRKIRQFETFETLKRVLLENSDCKFVFFTGDLFDGEYNESTIIDLCKLFTIHENVEFFISFGNHDYLLCKSSQRLFESAPKNVHMFSDSMSFFEFPDCGLRIYGCSFSAPHVHTSFLNGFKLKNNEMVNIMLLHGDISASSCYNPLDVCDIARSNLDYLALGHKHNFSGINQISKTNYAYPGILEPRGFDECGICGVIKGEVIENGINFEFLPANARCYECVDFDITGIVTKNELVENLNSFLDKNNLYRINLIGIKHAELIMDIDFLQSILNVFYCEITDNTTQDVDIFMYSHENSLRGKTAQILEEYITQNQFDDLELQKNVIKTLTDLLCKGGED